MADELLPCRFCGNTPIDRFGDESFPHALVCTGCNHIVFVFTYTDDLIKLWNTRNEKNNPFIEDKANGV